ncbi:MAG: hypothetical protein ACYC6T_15130 [Thermoleophilia bacterium]
MTGTRRRADPEALPAADPVAGSGRRWRVLAILCAGLFMLLLDGTIVNIAIIMGEFVSAMKTTFLASMMVLVAGSVIALLIRSHVRRSD